MAPAEKKVTEKAKTTKQSLKTEVKQCLNKKEKEKETERSLKKELKQSLEKELKQHLEKREKEKEKEQVKPQVAQGFAWLVQQDPEPLPVIDWSSEGESPHPYGLPDTHCRRPAQSFSEYALEFAQSNAGFAIAPGLSRLLSMP
ncbi:MAG: hypothetical protein FRX48_09582 [Lasallia pustulata]|uniref:Uncharacterized protein n=1 Tax=Lasallia pustulata TaxID=136370 RepID=A0A5M8PCH8_9LECA|nr:MAG: hypothetical protein FRX48_09582 [Lasallia pustulata]